MSREPEPASLALNHSSSTDQQDYQLGHLGQDARLSCKMQDYLTSLASIPHLDNRHDTVYQPHRIVMRRLTHSDHCLAHECSTESMFTEIMVVPLGLFSCPFLRLPYLAPLS